MDEINLKKHAKPKAKAFYVLKLVFYLIIVMVLCILLLIKYHN